METRIERVAIKALSGILEELKSKDARVKGVGVVGSPDRDLERIGNRQAGWLRHAKVSTATANPEGFQRLTGLQNRQVLRVLRQNNANTSETKLPARQMREFHRERQTAEVL